MAKIRTINLGPVDLARSTCCCRATPPHKFQQLDRELPGLDGERRKLLDNGRAPGVDSSPGRPSPECPVAALGHADHGAAAVAGT
jgi:hypothetical protein